MSWSTYDSGALVEQGDDATRTVTTYPSGDTRPYTQAENDAADAALAEEARMDSIESRIARIEAHLWPAPPDPTAPADAPTWAETGGIWPDLGLLLDGGIVYRNVSGVPLTTPPSGFPGDPSAWGHLFIVALDTADPPTGEAWAVGVAYVVGDIVTYEGSTYTCLQAHTSQAGWTPAAVPSLWTLA